MRGGETSNFRDRHSVCREHKTAAISMHAHTHAYTHAHLSLGEGAGQLCGARGCSPQTVHVCRGHSPRRLYAALRRRDLGEAPRLAVLERDGPRELMPGSCFAKGDVAAVTWHVSPPLFEHVMCDWVRHYPVHSAGFHLVGPPQHWVEQFVVSVKRCLRVVLAWQSSHMRLLRLPRWSFRHPPRNDFSRELNAIYNMHTFRKFSLLPLAPPWRASETYQARGTVGAGALRWLLGPPILGPLSAAPCCCYRHLICFQCYLRHRQKPCARRADGVKRSSPPGRSLRAQGGARHSPAGRKERQIHQVAVRQEAYHFRSRLGLLSMTRT